jgi:hypothetical protein
MIGLSEILYTSIAALTLFTALAVFQLSRTGSPYR